MNLFSEYIVHKTLITSLLIAGSISVAPSAFASGYGPSPYYNPVSGAPASQRGQSMQTIKVEQAQADGSSPSYGGAAELHGESGARGQKPVSNEHLHH